MLTEIELLLIKPTDALGCSCLKQGLSLTFGCSQWEERKMQFRERTNKLGRNLEAQSSDISRDPAPGGCFCPLVVTCVSDLTAEFLQGTHVV